MSSTLKREVTDLTRRLLGPAKIAEWFGVETNTVITWLGRYREFPQPWAVTVTNKGEVPGWDPKQEGAIRAWGELTGRLSTEPVAR